MVKSPAAEVPEKSDSIDMYTCGQVGKLDMRCRLSVVLCTAFDKDIREFTDPEPSP